MKKHGIYVQKGKHFQFKEIYNNGYRMIRYLYQPLEIKFKSPMVNDTNQHFCGGWSMSDLDTSNEALLNRVIQGKKPMAVLSTWKKEDLDFCKELIDEDEYYVCSGQYETTRAYYRIVAVKGKMKELFDLQSLYETYQDNYIDINIREHEDKTLQDYFDDWDAQDEDSNIGPWVTGLILGYPVENTISVYREGVTS